MNDNAAHIERHFLCFESNKEQGRLLNKVGVKVITAFLTLLKNTCLTIYFALEAAIEAMQS
ncbi:hypothetical protein SAMN06295945_1457 [Polynucleobacter meluiroseus]|uniref:Uncharacterized protein n=1 Tax=Polynucleobacter meluiroseus TaxID=1938814 RepID=A0A240E1F5_9BURK|nr:hypothetical protein SAMN06295945_1457 [Polynucleobacter meluiroseus]